MKIMYRWSGLPDYSHILYCNAPNAGKLKRPPSFFDDGNPATRAVTTSCCVHHARAAGLIRRHLAMPRIPACLRGLGALLLKPLRAQPVR
jgi:hypothetical protein